MYSILYRLFLFLLLGLDWAADPMLLAPALQPLAKAWCSTENVCPSTGYQRAVRRATAPGNRPSGLESPPVGVAVARPPSASEVTRLFVSLASHLYVFMSLRR